MTTEAGIQKAIINYLRYRGCLVVRINSGGRPAEYKGKKRWFWFSKWYVLGKREQTAGVCDVWAVTPTGELLVIEVKAPGKQPTAAQREFMAELEKRLVTVVVADDVETVAVVFGG